MCNITKKTQKKTVTVYKTVRKVDKNYYGCFAGTKIQLGKARRQTLKDCKLFSTDFFKKGDELYNPIMVGKVSGFALMRNAINLMSIVDGRTVLKMVLGGEIWKGDASRISVLIDYDSTIFAGTEVLSFEEVK